MFLEGSQLQLAEAGQLEDMTGLDMTGPTHGKLGQTHGQEITHLRHLNQQLKLQLSQPLR